MGLAAAATAAERGREATAAAAKSHHDTEGFSRWLKEGEFGHAVAADGRIEMIRMGLSGME